MSRDERGSQIVRSGCVEAEAKSVVNLGRYSDTGAAEIEVEQRQYAVLIGERKQSPPVDTRGNERPNLRKLSLAGAGSRTAEQQIRRECYRVHSPQARGVRWPSSPTEPRE